jgi:uncharacterized protein YndB with AHSA1/START domain
MTEKENTSLEDRANRQIVITGVFDAPRDLVFKAWTGPQHVAQWWGPRGFTTRAFKLDLRPDGVFHYRQRSTDGHDMLGKWAYREIVAPERMACIVCFTDQNGNLVPHPMNLTWPLEIPTTLTLFEHQGRTAVRIRSLPHSVTASERRTFEAGLKSIEQGFPGTLDQLAQYLETASWNQAKVNDMSDHVKPRVTARHSLEPGDGM